VSLTVVEFASSVHLTFGPVSFIGVATEDELSLLIAPVVNTFSFENAVVEFATVLGPIRVSHTAFSVTIVE